MADHNDGVNESQLLAQRRAKLDALREAGNPYNNDFRRDALAADLAERFVDASAEQLEALDERFTAIETAYGVGYRWTGT